MEKKNAFVKVGNKIFRFSFVALLVAVLWGCSKQDDMDQLNPSLTDRSIPGILENFEVALNEAVEEGRVIKKAGKVPSFRTLTTALTHTQLMPVVARERLTLFAPSDDAFAAIGLNPGNIRSVPNLTDILLYHAVSGTVYSTDLSNEFVPTLNGAAVEINLDNGVFVNDASVVYADIRALNGVIHVVDEVLLPPTQNLVEIAISNPEFSILVEAVVKAGFAGLLSADGPFTVFAPTNDAFVNLLGELQVGGLDDIDVELLQQVLLYHVVPGRVFSSDLTSGAVATAQGGTFTVDVSSLTITDNSNRVAHLNASLLNIQANNGVIHVIDKVILP